MESPASSSSGSKDPVKNAGNDLLQGAVRGHTESGGVH